MRWFVPHCYYTHYAYCKSNCTPCHHEPRWSGWCRPCCYIRTHCCKKTAVKITRPINHQGFKSKGCFLRFVFSKTKSVRIERITTRKRPASTAPILFKIFLFIFLGNLFMRFLIAECQTLSFS